MQMRELTVEERFIVPQAHALRGGEAFQPQPAGAPGFAQAHLEPPGVESVGGLAKRVAKPELPEVAAHSPDLAVQLAAEFRIARIFIETRLPDLESGGVALDEIVRDLIGAAHDFL